MSDLLVCKEREESKAHVSYWLSGPLASRDAPRRFKLNENLTARELGIPKPCDPLHFDIIEGGRKRVSDIFIDKNSVSCT